jgi:hypothetical protein
MRDWECVQPAQEGGRDCPERRGGEPYYEPMERRVTRRRPSRTAMATAAVRVESPISVTARSMTLDRYSHVSTTMQQDAAEMIDQLLAPEARPNRGHDAG